MALHMQSQLNDSLPGGLWYTDSLTLAENHQVTSGNAGQCFLSCWLAAVVDLRHNTIHAHSRRPGLNTATPYKQCRCRMPCATGWSHLHDDAPPQELAALRQRQQPHAWQRSCRLPLVREVVAPAQHSVILLRLPPCRQTAACMRDMLACHASCTCTK